MINNYWYPKPAQAQFEVTEYLVGSDTPENVKVYSDNDDGLNILLRENKDSDSLLSKLRIKLSIVEQFVYDVNEYDTYGLVKQLKLGLIDNKLNYIGKECIAVKASESNKSLNSENALQIIDIFYFKNQKPDKFSRRINNAYFENNSNTWPNDYQKFVSSQIKKHFEEFIKIRPDIEHDPRRCLLFFEKK